MPGARGHESFRVRSRPGPHMELPRLQHEELPLVIQCPLDILGTAHMPLDPERDVGQGRQMDLANRRNLLQLKRYRHESRSFLRSCNAHLSLV